MIHTPSKQQRNQQQTNSLLEQSLADCLPVIYGDWCESLLNNNNRKQLALVANHLPSAFLLHQVGFECDLCNPTACLDLLVAARQAQNGPVLVEHTAAQALNHFNNQHPVWASLKQLAVLWRSPLWSTSLDDLWLEFDVNGDNPLTPNLFMDPGVVVTDIAGWDAWWNQVGTLMLGLPNDASLNLDYIKDFYHCLQMLPQTAVVFQIGVMRARPPTGFRLCVSHLYLDAILEFLPNIGIHQGDYLRESLVALQTLADGFTVHVDIPFTEQPRLSLECYLGEQPAHAGLRATQSVETTSENERWARLLDYLQSQGLCLPQKKAALLQYNATLTPNTQTAEWPVGLLQLQQRIPLRSALRRWIHHIKLDFVSGRPVKAKAYLSVGHTWL